MKVWIMTHELWLTVGYFLEVNYRFDLLRSQLRLEKSELYSLGYIVTTVPDQIISPSWSQGEVLRVIDRYVAEISMLDSGDVVRVDQQELETVIPSPGGTVLVSEPISHPGSQR